MLIEGIKEPRETVKGLNESLELLNVSVDLCSVPSQITVLGAKIVCAPEDCPRAP